MRSAIGFIVLVSPVGALLKREGFFLFFLWERLANAPTKNL
jgi:hypothetical protein